MNNIVISGNTNLIISRTGKTVGVRHFMGKMSASEVKSAGRALGLKSSALSGYVREALSSEAGQRNAAAAAAVSALTTAGYVGDVCTVRAASATLTFKRPTDAKVPGAAKALRAMADKLVAAGKFASIEEALVVLA